MEKKHTISLMYRSKRSVGKFFEILIFFYFDLSHPACGTFSVMHMFYRISDTPELKRIWPAIQNYKDDMK